MLDKIFFPSIFVILLLAFCFDLSTGQDDGMFILGYNSEPRVYGRLAKSEADGVFSNGALQGFCLNDERQLVNMSHDTGPTNNMVQVQYYLRKRCPYFLAYKSHPGAQGIVFYLISRIYTSPDVFRATAGAVLSLAITYWLYWLSGYFGRTVAVLTFLSLFLLKWLIVFGDNIGLFVGTMYLPMVSLFWVIKKWDSKHVGMTAFLTMLISCLFSGAEFISSTVVMAFTPVVFYAVKRKWKAQRILNTGFKAALGVFSACLLALGLLFVQISAVDSFSGAVDHFIYSVGKRTYGDPQEYAPSDRQPLLQPLGRVILQYFAMPAIIVNDVGINFGQLIISYIVVSFFAMLLLKKSKDRNLLALLATTWIGLLGPLSWLVLCKAHAYAHSFMDPLVWHMPFVLYGMALTGATAKGMAHLIWVKIKNNKPDNASWEK